MKPADLNLSEASVTAPLPDIRLDLAQHAPLRSLAGSDLARRFQWWHGLSGRRYLVSIFSIAGAGLDACPRYDAAVVLAVRREADGRCHILCADETGCLPDLFFESAGFRAALAQGANEIHVHLLAEEAEARRVILSDLEA